MEPFTRAGRHVNLAGSDRAARKLSFKPVHHAAAPSQPALQEALQLECPPSAPLRLTRTLHLPGGLLAVLAVQSKADGATPAELLACLAAIPLQRQFAFGAGHLAAMPRLAVVVDVSGSIDDAVLARFATEIDAITRRLEAGLTLAVGDDRVRAVTHCERGHSTLAELKFEGGGGTDFTPLPEEADHHRPDIYVVLTDLEDPALLRPRWLMVWAVQRQRAAAVPPFGRVLVLD